MAATKGADPALAGDKKAGRNGKSTSDGLAATDPNAVIAKLKLSDDELLRAYQEMLNIRHFEEQCNRAFRAGKVGGYLHLYIGQEAVSTGIINCLKKGDEVLSTYRDHAHTLALGADPGRVMAEIYGKPTGVSNGKGGSMHLYDKEHGFAGGYGIVGGNVPIATGLGWALKYKKTDNICVCYFGDGSMNAGAFHESLNMAALYRLPVLYVLENNGYAMGTSIERSHANTDLGSRAESYAIPHAKVDGQNYFAVRELAAEVVEKMRKDPYPFFIDAITYRYVGHGAADGAETQKTYREESEVEKWKQRDPLIVLGEVLQARGLIDDAKKKQMDEQGIEFAKAAAKFAEESPTSPPEDLYKDVYVA
jgi:pyruvate dehydrogenase E1 component alpha subunit